MTYSYIAVYLGLKNGINISKTNQKKDTRN